MERGLKGVESNGALTLLNANALMLAARYLSGVARRLELTTEEQQGLEQRRRELSRQEASAWLARACGATPTVRGARDRGRHLITKKTHTPVVYFVQKANSKAIIFGGPSHSFSYSLFRQRRMSISHLCLPA